MAKDTLALIGSETPAVAVGLTMPALVMLTACVNVAALLLSRAVGRQREMAVRLALGTSRAALVRMLLVENLLVSGLASLVSLFLVYRLPPGIALLLAIVGVVATVWADASRRRREFAIRLALGAGPAAVRRQVISTGMWPVHSGVLFGRLLSWSAVKLVEAQHVLPLASVAAEPSSYLLVAALLLTTALATLLAVAVPVGRRDPLFSLREE